MRKLITILLIAILLIPSTVLAFGNTSSNGVSFDAKTLKSNTSFRTFIINEANKRTPVIQVPLTNFSKPMFQEIFDYISKTLIDQSETDLYSVNVKVTFSGSNAQLKAYLLYRMDSSQESQVNAWIKSKMDPFLAGKPSEKDIIKFINDTIVRHMEYDTTLQKRSAYNAVFDKTALCEGYAMLGKMMLNYAGIENKIVVGNTAKEKHMWNMVKYGHNWYHMDFTWNDPIYASGTKDPNSVSYQYFMKSDDTMSKTHTWSRQSVPAAAHSF